MELITVIVVDDDDDLRAALAEMLGTAADIEVVGSGADAFAGVELCAQVPVDVAVLDVHLPGGGGPTAAAGIRERSPATRLIAMSVADDRSSRERMAAAGVDDFVAKDELAERLLPAIRAAGRGVGPSES